ncbi:MAG: phosphate ABC transporter permease subunit PstC [Ktedonobacteraceae bacterium]|nr:phosphate ABC transporter permease subunit PstC [Ktedonobacteraceae bacterium]
MQVQQRSQASYAADHTARIVFLICAALVVLVIVAIFAFVGANAFKVFGEGANVGTFFFGTNWDPTGNGGFTPPSFGAGGLILGSIVITLISVVIATPLSFGMALFFTELSPRWLTRLLQPLIEIFTGMPSVVIGFFGLVVIVPFLLRLVGNIVGNHQTAGFGWGAAIVVLLIMILPTIISISIDALRAVPNSIREASLALGSTRWQMMVNAVLPAATTGLATAVVLGMARAIGETLAVSLVLGGSSLPSFKNLLAVFFQPNVNITQAIANGFGEAIGAASDAYYTLAFVLLVISFIFVSISRYLASRSVYK